MNSIAVDLPLSIFWVVGGCMEGRGDKERDGGAHAVAIGGVRQLHYPDKFPHSALIRPNCVFLSAMGINGQAMSEHLDI